MAPLSQIQARRPIKLLFVGDSGTGKTGALASLADAGYRLRILDLDNGIDILRNLILSPKTKYNPGCINNISAITLTEKMRPVNGKLIPVKATVWTNMVKLLDYWKDEGEDLGKVETWGVDDVLVIDSLSMVGIAAINFHLQINGRLMTGSTGNEYRRDIGQAQSMMENLLQLLYDDNIHCNVIVNSHIAYVDDPGEAGKDAVDRSQTGYPNALGKALSPKIPRYFNTVLMAKTEGSGSSTRHRIFTKSQGMVNLKSSAPLDVPLSYDLSTGLAEYFRALQKGEGPKTP
jgi:hypothetical protein